MSVKTSHVSNLSPTAPASLPPVSELIVGKGRRLRVLHIYRRFHPDYTGDGIYYTRLIPHLAACGIDNEVLSYETRTPDGTATSLHEGIPVHYLANIFGDKIELGLLRWLAANIWRFDLVHLHSHVDRRFISYAFIRLCGRPVLFSCTLDDSPTHLLQDYNPHNRGLARQLMRAINGFVVISPHLLRRSLETMPNSRLHFIPQGVGLDFASVATGDRAAARAELGLAAEDLLLLNVGSVSRRKNVAFLVEALAQIPDPTVKLVIVGPLLDEGYLAEIKARMVSAGLEGRVILAGFQSDPALWYTAADALVFASTAEGFPNVYLEAMSRNLPIVTLFLPGLTDFIVDHGRTGFLARDQGQFVEALLQLRAAPALRISMGDANRRFAERNLEMGTVATSYAKLYREQHTGMPAIVTEQRLSPDLDIRFTSALAGGPRSIGLKEFDVPAEWPPLLQVVIDTEAHFDWNKGVATDVGQVSSIVGLQENFDVFRRHGVLPTLVVDHPIATQQLSAVIMRDLAAEGCEIGVHMHSWTTPPLVEIKDNWHSFSGNLGSRLERAKILNLKQQVEKLLGRAPRIFKAGRYGLGPNTIETIEELGFDIDLSICPLYDYSHLGGPDFSRFTSRPGWFGQSRRLLSLPTTAAPIGWLAGKSDAVIHMIRSGWGRQLGLGRLAARLHAFHPLRLSPEGCDFEDMKRVTRHLHRSGQRIFTLSLHSPTLQIGNTPYVNSHDQLQAMLQSIDRYLAFFRDEMGGSFTTPSCLHARLSELIPQTAPQPKR